ncbi:MAG: hypothetical protein SFU25_10995 [Candidatus Caenarcaniphilales bacterium]|nr:hypothetical protein [Candidatus Caenarcaniphilales bacterium]
MKQKFYILFFISVFSIGLFPSRCLAWEYQYPQQVQRNPYRYNNSYYNAYSPAYFFPMQSRVQAPPIQRNNTPVNSYGGATALDVLSGKYQYPNNIQQETTWGNFTRAMNDPAFVNMLTMGANNYLNQQEIERQRLTASFKPIYEGAFKRWEDTVSSINIRPYAPSQPAKSIMPESYTLSPKGFGDWKITKNGYGY